VARRERFVEQYRVPVQDALVLTAEPEFADFFEAICRTYPNAKEVSNWLMGDYRRLARDMDGATPPTAERMARMLSIIDAGIISKKIGKSVLEEMFRCGEGPDEIVESRGWKIVSSTDTLKPIIEAVLQEHASVVGEYRGGKEKSFGFLVGQVMKQTQGKAAPADVNRLLKEMLN